MLNWRCALESISIVNTTSFLCMKEASKFSLYLVHCNHGGQDFLREVIRTNSKAFYKKQVFAYGVFLIIND